MTYNQSRSDYTVNKFYDRDGNLSGINFILNNYKVYEDSASCKSATLIYAVKDQRWFAETPFDGGTIALEPGRAFNIASFMGLEDKVAEILKEEGM